MGKKQRYTVGILRAGGYIAEWYVACVLDENGDIVSPAEASWLWVAKLRAKKLRRLARKGVFFQV